MSDQPGFHAELYRASKGNGADASHRFKLKPFEQITLSKTPNYLVKGIIPRAGLAIVWGPPKCGKSFWTFDLVMHVALGWEYRGRRVQQGPVVYCALEGGHGFRNRVEAWRRRHLSGHHDAVPFYLLDVPVDLIADRDKLIQAVRVQLGEPVVVVIDTLNRALIGDENKSDDMSKLVRAADAVREAFGCLVVLVHHCGVASTRPRGHSSLSGADDAQIAIERNDDGLMTVTVEHMKDAEAGAIIACRLERVDLGLDDDGDPMGSCIVLEAVAVEKEPKLAEGPRLAYDQLRKLIEAKGCPSARDANIPSDVRVVSAIEWREAFYAAYPAGKPDTKQKAFVRAHIKLMDEHLIEVWSDKVWLNRTCQT
jgi:hypothetical protein